MDTGALCVTTSGTVEMLRWSVTSWDLILLKTVLFTCKMYVYMYVHCTYMYMYSTYIHTCTCAYIWRIMCVVL